MFSPLPVLHTLVRHMSFDVFQVVNSAEFASRRHTAQKHTAVLCAAPYLLTQLFPLMRLTEDIQEMNRDLLICPRQKMEWLYISGHIYICPIYRLFPACLGFTQRNLSCRGLLILSSFPCLLIPL